MTTITERVAAGAAFLDEHDPQWWREDVPRAIDLDTLELGDPASCVLGQRCPLEVLRAYHTARYGPYTAALYASSAYWAYAEELSGLDSEATDAWALEHGFALSTLGGDSLWDDLTTAWSDLITKRRKDATDRGELA